MKRREFIAILGSGAVAWPLVAHPQQPEQMRRVGVLMGYAEIDPAAQAQVAALRQELRKLGWEEGRNIRIDVRFPAADADRVRAMLMELMSLRPDVLVSNSNLVWQLFMRKSAPYQLFSHLSVIPSAPVLSATMHGPTATSLGSQIGTRQR